MALTRTRLYYGTGFGVGDTPYYSSILDTASYRDFESHFDLQELFLTSIRLKATYDQVESADYLRFGSAYYWITGISMINVNTAELYLELDACATCHGIGNIDFVEGEGIIERAHPLHDGDFENILPEPIGPKETLLMRARQNLVGVGNPGNTDFEIVVSSLTLNTPLTKDPVTGQVYPTNAQKAIPYSINGEDVLYLPSSPSGAIGCTVNGIKIPLNYYKSSENIMNQIAYLRSLGLEQAIQCCYRIPRKYITPSSPNGSGMYTNIIGASQDANGPDWKSGLTSKWKKTLTIGNTYIVSSLLSGDTQAYKVEDIVMSGQTGPIFRWLSDPNMNGKPIIWPKYYHHQEMTSFIGANGVSGIEWLKIPLALEGASGSLWINNNMIHNKGMLELQGTQTALNTSRQISGDVSDIAKPFKRGIKSQVRNYQDSQSALGLGFDVGNAYLDVQKYAYETSKLYTDFAEQKMAVPDIIGNTCPGLQSLIPNDFVCYHFTMGPDDIARVDKFFDNYGYTQNCAFDSRYLDLNPNGQGFCYVKASGVKVSKDISSIILRNKIEEQIQNGVRIWRKLPS